MKYRKKPVEIEAMPWDGNNTDELLTWSRQWTSGVDHVVYEPLDEVMEINTLEGVMTAQKGDYIICGVEGELYPCKPKIFEKTYEKVE